MAEPAPQLPEEDRPDIRPDLREAEEGGLYNAFDDQEKAVSPRGLGDKETSGGANERAQQAFGRGREDNSAEGAFGRNRNRDTRDRVGKGYTEHDRKPFLSRLKGSGLLRRRTLALVGVPAAAIALFLVFLMLIAGALKLPQVAQNIETYEFARVATQFAQNASRTTDEALALESTSDSTYSKLKDRFTQGYTDVRNSTWGRLDAYRPDKVLATLGDENGLQLQYKASGITGRKILTGATLNGVDYEVKQVNNIAKWVPGLNRVLETKNATSFLAKSDFLSAVNQQMKNDGIGTVIRGKVADNIIKEAGGSRVGWVLSKFKGLTSDQDAQIEASVQEYNATEAGNTAADNAATAEVKAADSGAQSATQKEVNDWKPSTTSGSTSSDLAETINSGIDKPAEAAANAALSGSLLKTTLGIVDPLYAVFTPICIVYDGSVVHSQPTIDNQTNQQQNAFDQIAAEAAQQQNGDTTATDTGALQTAIKGTNAELGDITKSQAYIRASGGTVDTTSIPSAEAGASGSFDYTLYDAIGISNSSTVGKIADYITGNTCSALTNTATAAGIGAANILLAIVTFGGSEAGEEAAGQGAVAFARTFVNDAVSNIFSKQVTNDGVKTIERGALNRAFRFAFKQGITIGGTFGLAELAHLIVAARAGQENNGLAQGHDLVDTADSGANIESGKLQQHMLFGRPLDSAEVSQADTGARQYVGSLNASKGFAQRYFAIDNANSLISHMAFGLSSVVHGSIASSFMRISAALLKPLGSLGTLFHLSGVAAATPSPITQHYGNVQFGWSDSENRLINSDGSYKTLENQRVLDSYPGVEDQIAQKYAKCFGYKYDSGGNGDLDPTDDSGNLQPDSSATLGSLLASGDIQRDSKGNVIDNGSGLCSPHNLGSDSPDSLADNPYSKNNQRHDLIFRWRLAMSYDTGLDFLINEQGVSQ